MLLLSNDSIRERSHLPELEPLSSDYAYSVVMIMAMLTYQSACGCTSKGVGFFNRLFLYQFLLKYCYKYTNP